MAKAIILRFRDLVTPEGDTIKKHQEISQLQEYVYWGWWAKPHERIPSIFRKMLEKEVEFEFVYLFDTGTKQLYKAELLDTFIARGEAGEACPTPDACPEYYRESRGFKTWFRFKDINKVDGADVEAELHQFSYCDSDFGLFADKTEFFEDFRNKQVSSLDELQHQDRTVWFVKEYEKGQSTKEILLINANVATPEDFSSNYTKLSGSKIHWVTDLHFSDVEDFHQFNDKKTATQLKELVAEKFEGELQSLIVSGDMTWKSSTSEFKQVEDFYSFLGSKVGLDKSKIGFCPGNHDVMFSEELPQDLLTAIDKLHSIQQGKKGVDLTPEDKLSIKMAETSQINKSAYENHFKAITSAKANEYLSMGRKYLINNQRPVDICFLNTNTVEQYKYLFQGQGFIGQDQRNDARKRLGWSKEKAFGAIRIVVLHHNLIPVEYARKPTYGMQGSVVYDAQATIDWCIKNKVDAVLHGHTHERSVMKLSQAVDNEMKSIWIVGLGSTGVSDGHRVEGHPNQMAELDFTGEYIKIQFHEIKNNSWIKMAEPIEFILD